MKTFNRRECVGPRGARRILPTPCAECVAVVSCRPGECSRPWGCDSWVNESGFRPDPAADDVRLLRIAEAGAVDLGQVSCYQCDAQGTGSCPESDGEAADGAACESFRDGSGPVLVPYVDGPAPFVPAELEGAQGVLPMPDAGPLFGAMGEDPAPADWDDGSDAEGGR